MTLDEYSKKHDLTISVVLKWLPDLWQAAHSAGEKVGWQNGMREAIETLDQVRWGYDGDCGAREKLEGIIVRSIDSRNKK